jgi:Protein of unknown function (DUF5132)
MALFDDAFKSFGNSWVPKVLMGVGVALVAPVVVTALAGGLRSLVKTAIKGGMIMYDKSQEMVAEAGEQLSDLVAEACAELKASAQETQAHAATPHNHSTTSYEAAE